MICHVQKTFQAMTCQICGSVFKTKCDKIEHLKREHTFFYLIKEYLNSVTVLVFVLGWKFCSVCVITHSIDKKHWSPALGHVYVVGNIPNLLVCTIAS